MNEEFYLHILEKQSNIDAVPPNRVIAKWAYNLLNLVFPERAPCTKCTLDEIVAKFKSLEQELTDLLNATKACNDCNNDLVAETFFKGFPELYRKMNTDI